jgi:group II intron reverse transcriptase/maturase
MTSTHHFLTILHRLGRESIPVGKVYRRMKDIELFKSAYARMAPNAGNMTPGVTDETIDGMSMVRIHQVISELEAGTFCWTPVRRAYIPKSNGKLRPLGIPTWKDKLVQEVIRMVLEAYYEPQFSDASHGFRPNRGCHTALMHIRDKWTGTRWFIEGDIKGCFDNIPHETILSILARNFQDNRFLKLIRTMLKAGYMEEWTYHATFSGTPQGGVASPILANIVLNELDRWVETTLIPKHTRGKGRIHSLAYAQAQEREKTAYRQGDIETAKRWRRQRRQLPQSDPQDPNYSRLHYCRYADDFILGWIGNLDEAEHIKQEIADFLQTLGLSLSEEKTLVTHARTQRARFLGYELKVAWDDSKMTTYRRKGKLVKSRTVNGVIQLLVPKDVVQKWTRKYMDKGKPARQPRLLHFSDFEIIARLGGELHGLCNYYLLAMNVHVLSEVVYVCKQAALHTLCNKHKVPNTSVYWRKLKRKLENGVTALIVERPNPNNPDKPFLAKLGAVPLRTQKRTTLSDKVFRPYLTRTELLTRLTANECELCGATGDVEVHHIRKLKDLKHRWQGRTDKPAHVQAMIAMCRKTLVVCKNCHRSIHNGTHDGVKLG